MSELCMLWKKGCFFQCLYGGCQSHPAADVTGALDLFPRTKPEGLNCLKSPTDEWWWQQTTLKASKKKDEKICKKGQEQILK